MAGDKARNAYMRAVNNYLQVKEAFDATARISEGGIREYDTDVRRELAILVKEIYESLKALRAEHEANKEK